MNKFEFLERLRSALVSLPWEECQSAMKYYEEYFAEAGEDREEEILKELGSPEAVAATILSDYSSAPARLSDVKPGQSTTTTGYSGAGYSNAQYSSAQSYHGEEPVQEPWYRRTPLWVLILLAIFTVPIWGSLLGVFVSLLGALFAVVAAIVAFMAAMGIAGIALTVGGLITFVVGLFRVALSPAAGLITMGASLLLVGLGILAGMAAVWLFTTAVPAMVRGIVGLIRKVVTLGGRTV